MHNPVCMAKVTCKVYTLRKCQIKMQLKTVFYSIVPSKNVTAVVSNL